MEKEQIISELIKPINLAFKAGKEHENAAWLRGERCTTCGDSIEPKEKGEDTCNNCA